jgi:rhodanese-related sulfurtransferase
VQITPAEVFKAVYNQNVNLILLDVRPEADFNLYHLDGAINVPWNAIEESSLIAEPSRLPTASSC